MRFEFLSFRHAPRLALSRTQAERMHMLLPQIRSDTSSTFMMYKHHTRLSTEANLEHLQGLERALRADYGEDSAHLLGGILVSRDGRTYSSLALLGDRATVTEMVDRVKAHLFHAFELGTSPFYSAERRAITNHFLATVRASLADDVPLPRDVFVLYRELSSWKEELGRLQTEQLPLLPETLHRLVRLGEVVYGLGPETSPLFRWMVRRMLEEMSQSFEELKVRLHPLWRPSAPGPAFHNRPEYLHRIVSSN
jgi:hypothetical protein